MADNLKAKRIQGGRFTADDKIECKFAYTGEAYTCLHYIEQIAGVDVTHGGGAAAGDKLHYKNQDRDADGDGIIDYSTTEMYVEQASKGESVIKIVAEIMYKAEHDAWETESVAWYAANTTTVGSGDTMQIIPNEGVLMNESGTGYADEPPYPASTIFKTGEIVLEWRDDTYK